MFDYKEQILEFLKLNFSPSSPEDANFKVTNNELLNYLFQIFPFDCISDYDLNEILIALKYERFSIKIDTSTSKTNKDGNVVKNQSAILGFCWCMHSKLLDFKQKL